MIFSTRVKIFSILIIIFFGIFKYWQHHMQYQDQLVAKNFQTMLFAMSINDTVTARTHGAELLKYSNRTPYPRLAALLLAKLSVIENNLNEAVNKLNLIVTQNELNKKNKKDKRDPIWHLANLRLAKVLLLQNKLSDVKNVLETGMVNQEFSSVYHELNGDLLVAEQKLKEANQAYNEAVKNLPQQINAPWLDLKITDTSSSVSENI